MIDKNTFKNMVDSLLKEIGYYNDLEKLSKEEKEKISSFKENFLNENFDLLTHVNGAAGILKNKNENISSSNVTIKEENKIINNINDIKNNNESIGINESINSNININSEEIKNENNS